MNSRAILNLRDVAALAPATLLQYEDRGDEIGNIGYPAEVILCRLLA